MSVRLTSEPLDAGAAITFVCRPEAGGTGVFVGTTRDSFQGRRVVRLEYEAFEPMARKALARIADALVLRYRLAAVALWHRTGSVPVGEASVVIAASSVHRREALEAAAAGIAAVKARVPVWKREWYAGDDRAWKENCECAGAAAEAVPAATLRRSGADVDADAWLGRIPAEADDGSGAGRVGRLAGRGHRHVEPDA